MEIAREACVFGLLSFCFLKYTHTKKQSRNIKKERNNKIVKRKGKERENYKDEDEKAEETNKQK